MKPRASSLILALSLLAASASARADETALADPAFLEQYAATYRFRLGHPTDVKVLPDGAAVLYHNRPTDAKTICAPMTSCAAWPKT